MTKKIIKYLVFTFLILSLITYFYSCQIEDTSMKRVKIVSIPNQVEEQQLKIFEHYKFSYIFYRKNFIYFFDTNSRTLYKFTKTGDTLLKITYKNINTYKDLAYLKPLNKENIKTKITRNFPFPEVFGIYIDYEDNIFLKVNFDDLTQLFEKYIGKNQKINYVIINKNNMENSKNSLNNSTNSEQNNNNDNNLNNNTSKNNQNYRSNNLNENKETSNGKKEYNIVFLKFDKYGDLQNIICKSLSDPFFNYFTKIHFFKDDSFVISEEEFTGDEEGTNEIAPEKHDSINFYLVDKDFKLLNKTNFSIVDIPKTETEKKDLYNLFIINYLVTEDKSILFDVFYYKNNIPEYYKIIKLDKMNLNKIYTIYQKQLLVNKMINGEKKKVLLFGEYLLNVTPDNFYFFIKYIDENKANLIIKDKYFKTLVSKIIDVSDIYSENQFFVGEDGSLYAYSDISNNFNILYWASDVILRKIALTQ